MPPLFCAWFSALISATLIFVAPDGGSKLNRKSGQFRFKVPVGKIAVYCGDPVLVLVRNDDFSRHRLGYGLDPNLPIHHPQRKGQVLARHAEDRHRSEVRSGNGLVDRVLVGVADDQVLQGIVIPKRSQATSNASSSVPGAGILP